jgi:hypothetical protein
MVTGMSVNLPQAPCCPEMNLYFTMLRGGNVGHLGFEDSAAGGCLHTGGLIQIHRD